MKGKNKDKKDYKVKQILHWKEKRGPCKKANGQYFTTKRTGKQQTRIYTFVNAITNSMDPHTDFYHR